MNVSLIVSCVERRESTHIYAHDQADKHCIQTSNRRCNAFPDSLPLSCNRLAMVMATERYILFRTQTDVTLARVLKIEAFRA